MKKFYLLTIILFFYFEIYSQSIGISDGLFTPRSNLHVHLGNSSGTILQLTNSSSGNASNSVGFGFTVNTNAWTLRNFQDGEFRMQTGNSFMSFYTNGSERLRIQNLGNIGIGTSTPDNSAILELSSTSQGFLPPRMTTAQRDAISNPAFGLQIINSESECLEMYADDWFQIFCKQAEWTLDFDDTIGFSAPYTTTNKEAGRTGILFIEINQMNIIYVYKNGGLMLTLSASNRTGSFSVNSADEISFQASGDWRTWTIKIFDQTTGLLIHEFDLESY